MLLWDFPFNKQQDIKRFQIYRRDALDKPFELLREIDFDNSTIRKDLTASSGNKNNIRRASSPLCCFYDTEFNIESSYIYAVAAIDARGMTSGYSSQFIVSYNRFTNKTNAEFISKEGAPKPYPNIFLEIEYLGTDYFGFQIQGKGRKNEITVQAALEESLKKLFKNYLPKKIINREKIGFPVPISKIFNNKINPMDQWLEFNMHTLNIGY